MGVIVSRIDRLSIVLLGLLLISLSVGCVTPVQNAQRALESSDYVEAVESSLIALEEEPTSIEANRILYSAWKQANDEWEKRIALFEMAEDAWEYEKSIPYYDLLFLLHTMVEEAKQMIPNASSVDIYDRREVAREQSARMHVSEGSKLIMPGTRVEAKVALIHFLRARELDPDYPLLEDKIARAEEMATTRIFVFTGADANIGLNGIEMFAALEDGLDRLDGVQVVRVPNRYGAPIDDNHEADEFAIGHGANLMLHVEPDTTYSVSVEQEVQPLVSAPWERETLRLVASAKTNIRYVLTDLEHDSTVSEGTFTVSDTDDGGFSVSAILHEGVHANVYLDEGLGARELLANEAPQEANDIIMLYQLKHDDGLDIPDYSSGRSLGVEAATYSTGEKIKPDIYTHPSEMAVIPELQNHTFWLFDAIGFDTSGEGERSYQFVYQQQLKVGVEGHLITAAYERDLYRRIGEWMHKPAIQKTVLDRFFPSFYSQTVPAEIVEEIATLF